MVRNIEETRSATGGESIEKMLPTAKEAMAKIAEIEGQKAARERRFGKGADDAKKKLIERLSKPSGLSRDDRIKLAARVIQRAVDRGVTEVEVFRFPNVLCTDKGRAINQSEPGWENTLTGIPREIYELWREHLQPRGYKIRYQIIEFPGGMPGDIGVTLSWS